jgi:hypothetical protein
MTKETTPMTFDIVAGKTRDFHVDRAGCCGRCGFMEQGLVCWYDGHDFHVECEECTHQAAPDRFPELRVVFMPELSQKAFSNYVRVLAWLTFAARVDRLHGHDFSKGTLARRFETEEAWNAPFRWTSLAEGIEDRYAGDVARAGLRQARDAFAFVARRIGKTIAMHGSAASPHVSASVGEESFERDYRVMSASIATARIRSWGASGSTFRLLAARTEQKTR